MRHVQSFAVCFIRCQGPFIASFHGLENFLVVSEVGIERHFLDKARLEGYISFTLIIYIHDIIGYNAHGHKVQFRIAQLARHRRAGISVLYKSFRKRYQRWDEANAFQDFFACKRSHGGGSESPSARTSRSRARSGAVHAWKHGRFHCRTWRAGRRSRHHAR